MAFLLTELLVLLIIIGLFLILSAVWPPDSPWAPWWQMPEDVIEKMCTLAKISSKDTIYDLGCGTGKALVFAAKAYHAKGVGIEIDPIRFILAKWNVGRFGQKEKITLYKKNFFDVTIGPASIIFVYLIPKALGRLLPKFLNELQPGTKIISYIYDFPQIKEKKRLKLLMYEKEKKVYVYQLLAKS